MKKLKEEVKEPVIVTLTYKKLVTKTSSFTMYSILRQLGWKIKVTEFGRLI